MFSEHGAILFVVYFKDKEKPTVTYSCLTPVELKQYMKNAKSDQKTITIGMKEFVNSKPKDLELAIRKFHRDCELQTLCSNTTVTSLQDVRRLGGEHKFISIGEKPAFEDFSERLRTDDFYYILDDNNRPVAVLKAKPREIILGGKKISDAKQNKSFVTELTLSQDGKKLTFGPGFALKENMELVYNVCGTLNQRIESLSFLKCIIKDKFFLFEGHRINFSVDETQKNIVEKMFNSYKELRRDLDKLRITKDINLDLWTLAEISALKHRLESIINKTPVKLTCDRPTFYTIKLHDLNVIYFYNNGNNIIYDFLNFADESLEYKFITSLQNGKTSDNKYYAMKSGFYNADNFNIEQFDSMIIKPKYDTEETDFINLQILEMIKAYDMAHNHKLIDLAQKELNKLIVLDKNNFDIYKINSLQIKYRQDKLNSKDKDFLLTLKNKPDSNTLTKICCCILLSEKDEAEFFIRQLDKTGYNFFMELPIRNLLQ